MSGSAFLPGAAVRVAGLLGAACASPVIAIAALSIWLEDRGPVFFHQVRVGQGNRSFRLWKLRSMRSRGGGRSITAAGDRRITRVGTYLRRYKLDELPQLWNVARGDMTFIGSRPELPEYVDGGDAVWRELLEHKPGITNLAALVYRNEEQLLAGQPSPERFYREALLPAKLRLDLRYLRARSWRTDFKLLLFTVRFSFFPAGFDSTRVRRAFLAEDNHDEI